MTFRAVKAVITDFDLAVFHGNAAVMAVCLAFMAVYAAGSPAENVLKQPGENWILFY